MLRIETGKRQNKILKEHKKQQHHIAERIFGQDRQRTRRHNGKYKEKNVLLKKQTVCRTYKEKYKTYKGKNKGIEKSREIQRNLVAWNTLLHTDNEQAIKTNS